MAQGLIGEGEGLRQAVRWISDQRKSDPGVRLGKLIEEAALRFDLSPLESDFLWRTLRDRACAALRRSRALLSPAHAG